MKIRFLLPTLLAVLLGSCGDNTPTPAPVVVTKLNAPVVVYDEETKVMSWREVEDANSYKVYDNYNFVTSINDTSYTISISDYEKHDFYVTANDTAGNHKESDASNKITYRNSKGKLASPVLSFDSISIRVVWEKVEHADYYDVFDKGTRISTSVYPIYQINLVDYVEHIYTVVARDSTNEYSDSLASNAISFIQPHGVLDTPVVNFNSDSRTISWSAIDGANSYVVYKDAVEIDSISETSYLIVPTDLEEHIYQVKACDTTRYYRESAKSNEIRYTSPIISLATPVIDDNNNVSGVDVKNTKELTLKINNVREYALDSNTTKLDLSSYAKGKVINYKIKAVAKDDQELYTDSDYSSGKTYLAPINDQDIQTGLSYTGSNGAMSGWYCENTAVYSEGIGAEYGYGMYQARNITKFDCVVSLTARNFRSENSKISLFVNGTAIKEKTSNQTIIPVVSEDYLTFTFNLKDYIGQKVWVWIVGLTDCSVVIKEVNYSGFISTDDNVFIQDTHKNDSLSNSSWTSEVAKQSSVYKYANDSTVGNEGLLIHQDYQGYVSTKVCVSENAKNLTLNLRGYETRDSQIKVSINGNYVAPILNANEAKESVVGTNSVVHLYDGWTRIVVNLSTYINQEITIKVEIIANGDASVGGFYFTNTVPQSDIQGSYQSEGNYNSGSQWR